MPSLQNLLLNCIQTIFFIFLAVHFLMYLLFEKRFFKSFIKFFLIIFKHSLIIHKFFFNNL